MSLPQCFVKLGKHNASELQLPASIRREILGILILKRGVKVAQGSREGDPDGQDLARASMLHENHCVSPLSRKLMRERIDFQIFSYQLIVIPQRAQCEHERKKGFIQQPTGARIFLF
jgi:hypothetical protein